MERITIYCASDDQAVQLSTRLHGGHPRLGDFRLNSAKAAVHSPYESQSIDTIDASGLEGGLVRHGYIFSHAGVLEDACEVLKTGSAAATRPALVPKMTEHGLTYYVFKDSSQKASVIEQEMPEENTSKDSGFVE
jgi:esterase/lipase superfamily enzyme